MRAPYLHLRDRSSFEAPLANATATIIIIANASFGCTGAPKIKTTSSCQHINK